MLMTGANLQLQVLSSFGADTNLQLQVLSSFGADTNLQLQILSSFGANRKPAASDSEYRTL